MSTTRQADTSSSPLRGLLLFLIIAVLFVLEGATRNAMFSGSWNSALSILNMGLISAVTAAPRAGVAALSQPRVQSSSGEAKSCTVAPPSSKR